MYNTLERLSVLLYPLTNEYCTTYYYNISHRFSFTHRRNIIKKYMPGNTSRRIYEKIIQFHILSQLLRNKEKEKKIFSNRNLRKFLKHAITYIYYRTQQTDIQIPDLRKKCYYPVTYFQTTSRTILCFTGQ